MHNQTTCPILEKLINAKTRYDSHGGMILMEISYIAMQCIQRQQETVSH